MNQDRVGLLGSLWMMVALACGVSACQGTSLKGFSGGAASQPAAGKGSSEQSEGWVVASSNSKNVAVPCVSSVAGAAAVRVTASPDTAALLLPFLCFAEFLETKPPVRRMDLVFVLDTTGSMGNEIETVRRGVSELVALVQKNGWELRVGAVAFADEILDRVPLNSDVAAVLSAMSSQLPAWRAEPGFGGDPQESGLGALEASLEILGVDDDYSGQSHEKIVVYVSDAPAQRAHLTFGGFETVTTANMMNNYVKELKERGHSFQVFYSVGSSREHLLPDLPTPSEQFDALVQSSGSSFVKLGYPFTAEVFRGGLLTKLGEGRIVPEPCTLQSVDLHKNDGTLLLHESHASAALGNINIEAKIPTLLSKGSYVISVARDCKYVGQTTTRQDLFVD